MMSPDAVMRKNEDLSVAEALAQVLGHIQALPPEGAGLLDALGRVLVEPVIAGDSLPPFANSSMDGYALRAVDTAPAGRESPVALRVVADVPAGAPSPVEVTPGTAARVMTGAPLPAGADAVVPVEDTDEKWRSRVRALPEQVSIYRSVRAGEYVRMPGEDISTGEQVLEAGHVLRPQDLGVMASLGYSRARVVRRPRVGILATGNELVSVTAALTPGKIRNSNSYAQAAQVLAAGGEPILLGVAEDTEQDVRARLDSALELGVDLIVSSAGVSVGAYDVVKAVLEESGSVAFWRVRMRPGKPLAFGTYAEIPYIGLPGNPVSAMVSFEIFARPAILALGGHQKLRRPRVEVTLMESIRSDGRESYVRGIVTKVERGYEALTTGSQGSHVMSSMVKANALLIVPEGVTEVLSGSSLTALMIDWAESI